MKVRARIVLAFLFGFLTGVLLITANAPAKASTDEVLRYRAFLRCKAAAVNDVVTYKCLDLNPFYNG